MQVDRQEYLGTFISLVKSSRSKNEFLTKVQEFDQKFTESYPSPNFNQQNSLESFPSMGERQFSRQMSQQNLNATGMSNRKPKNPFLSNNGLNRGPQFQQPSQKNNLSPSNLTRPNNLINGSFQEQYSKPPQSNDLYSKTENNFYGRNTHNHYHQFQGEPQHIQGPWQKPSSATTTHSPFKNKSENPYQQKGPSLEQHYPPQPQKKEGPTFVNMSNPNCNNDFDDISKQFGKVLVNNENGLRQPFMNQQNPNELSVNSRKNHPISGGGGHLLNNSIGSAFQETNPYNGQQFMRDHEANQNEYLSGLAVNENTEPDFVKYYKKLIPPQGSVSNHQRAPMESQSSGRRVNPFAVNQ